MAKSYEEVKDVISVIKNEVEDGRNTAQRVGGAMDDIVDYTKESLESQEERINEETDTKIAELVVQETGDGEGVVMSQKAVSGKLAELKSELDYIIGDKNTILPFSDSAITADGKYTYNVKYRMSGMIPLEKVKNLSLQLRWPNTTVTMMALYSSDNPNEDGSLVYILPVAGNGESNVLDIKQLMVEYPQATHMRISQPNDYDDLIFFPSKEWTHLKKSVPLLLDMSNGYIQEDGGIFTGSNVWMVSDFLAIDDYSDSALVFAHRKSSAARQFAIYDADKNPLYIIPNGEDTINSYAPTYLAKDYDNARYFRICVAKDYAEIRMIPAMESQLIKDVTFSQLPEIPKPKITLRNNPYAGIGAYLSSKKLADEYLKNPIVDILLDEEDMMKNSAGKICLFGQNLFIQKSSNYVEEPIYPALECKYQRLARWNINTNIVDSIKIFDDTLPLTIDGIDYNVQYYMEGNLSVVDNKIAVTCWAILDNANKSCLVTKIVEPNTLNVISTNICNVKVGEETMVFSNENIANTQIGSYSGSCVIFNAGLFNNDGIRYGVAKFGCIGVFKTSDMINWEFVKKLELDVDRYHGECGIIIRGNDVLIAARTGYNNKYIGNHTIQKYNLASWDLVDSVIIDGCPSMLSFFESPIDGRIMLLSPGESQKNEYGVDDEGRQNYKISCIDRSNLSASRTLIGTNGVNFGPNTNVIGNNNGWYWGCLTGRNLRIVQFRLDLFTPEEVDDYFNSL